MVLTLSICWQVLLLFLCKGQTDHWAFKTCTSCSGQTVACSDPRRPCHITCSSSYACSDAIIVCPERWDCLVECTSSYSCANAEIYGPKQCGATLNVSGTASFALTRTNIYASDTEYVNLDLDSSYSMNGSILFHTSGGKLSVLATTYVQDDPAISRSSFYPPIGGEASFDLTPESSGTVVMQNSKVDAANSSTLYVNCNGQAACSSNEIDCRYCDQLHIDALNWKSLHENSIYCNTVRHSGQNCIINGTYAGSSQSGTEISVSVGNFIFAQQGSNDLKFYCNSAHDDCIDNTTYMWCGESYVDSYILQPCYFRKKGETSEWMCGNSSVTGRLLASEHCNSYFVKTPAPTSLSISDTYFNLIESNTMAWFWFFGCVIVTPLMLFCFCWWCCVNHNNEGLWWYERRFPDERALEIQSEQERLKKALK